MTTAVLAIAGVGHFSWHWPLQKLLTIAEGVGHCGLWPLQVALVISGAGHRSPWPPQEMLVPVPAAGDAGKGNEPQAPMQGWLHPTHPPFPRLLPQGV